MNTHWQPPPPQGRDPRTPFGSPQQPMQQPPPRIQDFQEPRSGLGRTLLIVITVVALIGGALFALQVMGGPEATSSPSASRGVPTAATSSLGASATSIDFDGYGKGTFEILSSSWGDKGLEVEVQVTLTEGQGTYTTYAFHNESMTSADPRKEENITIRAGESKTARYVFDLPRGAGTIVLATSTGTPVTALTIKG
ncbi:MAG: hypothetical protein Q4D89_00275 [Arachnia propionica]|uniref:hypothetical protein n=1 Tax=Arachnia propionica TaxID=1750 RepID=UPI00270AA026|nr:hypothetical protein [Arachnia propionica]